MSSAAARERVHRNRIEKSSKMIIYFTDNESASSISIHCSRFRPQQFFLHFHFPNSAMLENVFFSIKKGKVESERTGDLRDMLECRIAHLIPSLSLFSPMVSP
jgi:hypothetical protein